MAQNRSHTFVLSGGEDLVTPDLQMKDGVVRVAYNYEQNYNTGYTRINGYRKLVNLVTPGEGAILGTVVYDDEVYIFRNKVGGATAGMWKAVPAVYDDTVSPPTVISNGSWVEITDIVDSLGAPITLNPDGYYEFTVSNFKATVQGIGDFKGDYATNINYIKGDIVLDINNDLGDGINSVQFCTANHKSGPTMNAAYWLHLVWLTDTSPTDPHNIAGSAGNLYGVDGKNPAFEFNGTQLAQIDTTYTPDTPMHIGAVGNRLVVGFRAGEIALSVVGQPKLYDPIYGAGSIGVSDFLTGLQSGAEGTLNIYCKERTYILYGAEGSLDSAQLKKHSKTVGSYPYVQGLLGERSLFIDRLGITELAATDRFGDIITNIISKNIQTIITGQQPHTAVVLKDKAQYRVYYNSLTGGSASTTCIMATQIEGETLGFTHSVYPFDISTSASGIIGTTECNYVGTADGEVFHMDTGNSFNGEAYNSFITLPFNFLKSPHQVKKFRKVMLNVDALDHVGITGSANFSYGQRGQSKDSFTDIVEPKGDRWGVGVWNEFFWGTGFSDYIEAYINGHGENISITISTTSATDSPHTLKDIAYIYQHQRIEH